jgi:hypothetical protein
MQIKNEVKKLFNIETKFKINFKNQNNFERKLKNKKWKPNQNKKNNRII